MEDASGWAARIKAGDRRAIARAITAIENATDEGRALAGELNGTARRARIVGVTGPPGAGKSTLVNALARDLLGRGHSVAVIAVDPSSPLTGGAVLGDRVRMGEVHAHERIFIRSLAARGHLGGLTRTTAEVVVVLDAAGFDDVIIETVGTGQSEVEIAAIAGTRVVVYPPGAGDDIQALKAGVLEIADILVINKADLPDAERTEHDLRAMLALRRGGRKPPVLKTIATRGEGIAALADAVIAQAAAPPHCAASSPSRTASSAVTTSSATLTLPTPTLRCATSLENASPSTDETARALLQGLAARDAYMAHLGLEFVAGAEGTATVRMRVRPHHINFFGACHGGAIFSLADMALGLACNSYGTLAALIDAHITFPTAVKEGDVLSASATEVSRSRKLAIYRVDVRREGGTLVSSLTGTVYLPGRPLVGEA